MTLLDTIKAASLQARKERNAPKAALLSTLLGEAQMIGKNNGNRDSTDGEVIAVIKKMINNAGETIKHSILSITLTDKHDIVQQATAEIGVLTSFLPKQLSEEELSNEIDGLIKIISATSIKDMGKVMKALKEKHEGSYDGTQASTMIKQKLA